MSVADILQPEDDAWGSEEFARQKPRYARLDLALLLRLVVIADTSKGDQIIGHSGIRIIVGFKSLEQILQPKRVPSLNALILSPHT